MTSPPDEFDLLGKAAAGVLRRAMQGAGDLRAVGDRPEELLDELERAIASILREAKLAADEMLARAVASAGPSVEDEQAPPQLSVVAARIPTRSDAIRLTGVEREDDEGAPLVGPVFLRRKTRRRTPPPPA